MAATNPARRRQSELPHQSAQRTDRLLLLGFLLVSLVWLNSAGTAEAARRRGRGNIRQASAAARARKAQAIKVLQQQVAAARDVLAQAESRTAMSQSAVNEAVSKLSGIREQIDSAQDDAVQAAKTLHEIEKEIQSEQPATSELALAQLTLQNKREAVHVVLHQLYQLPEHRSQTEDAALLSDLAKLTPEQREELNRDPNYQVAQQDLKDAATKVEDLRKKLFLADKEWVEARKDLTEADQRTRASTQQAGTAGLGLFGDKQELHKGERLADAARAIVMQGEAQLRQLGASTTPNTKSAAGKKKKK